MDNQKNLKINKVTFQTFLKSDRAILILCISIALIFWLLIKLSKTYKTAQSFTINYHLPDGMTFSQLPTTSVGAFLSGRGWDLMSNYFINKDNTIFINLANVHSQNINNSLLKNKISAILSAHSIEIAQVKTDYIPIVLEENVEKKVKIKLQEAITFGSEFHLKSPIKYFPDSVNIRGPASLIQNLETWDTNLFEAVDLQKTIHKEIKLREPDNELIILSNSEIQLTIEVERLTQKSLFIPITLKHAPDSIRIFPDKIKVNCVIGISKFSAISKNDFMAEVNFKDLIAGTNTNTLPISITHHPPAVRNISFSPKSVEFLIVE